MKLGGIASTAENWEKFCDFERLEWSETESTKYKVTHLGLTRIFLNKNEDTGR